MRPEKKKISLNISVLWEEFERRYSERNSGSQIPNHEALHSDIINGLEGRTTKTLAESTLRKIKATGEATIEKTALLLSYVVDPHDLESRKVFVAKFILPQEDRDEIELEMGNEANAAYYGPEGLAGWKLKDEYKDSFIEAREAKERLEKSDRRALENYRFQRATPDLLQELANICYEQSFSVVKMLVDGSMEIIERAAEDLKVIDSCWPTLSEGPSSGFIPTQEKLDSINRYKDCLTALTSSLDMLSQHNVYSYLTVDPYFHTIEDLDGGFVTKVELRIYWQVLGVELSGEELPILDRSRWSSAYFRGEATDPSDWHYLEDGGSERGGRQALELSRGENWSGVLGEIMARLI